MIHTKELLDFIIKQGLPDVKYYPDLIPIIDLHFSITKRHDKKFKLGRLLNPSAAVGHRSGYYKGYQDAMNTQFSPPIEGEELYHWVKASERMPTETSGFAEDIIYKIQLDSGQRLRISTINQFLETVKYRITEKFEWLEKITPNKTLIEGKEEDESRTYTEQDILLKI